MRSIFYKCIFKELYKDNITEAVVQRCSVRRVFLKNLKKNTRKHLCQSLYFNKVASLRSATPLKKRLWHRCFPVDFAEFLRTPFLQNTSSSCFKSYLLPCPMGSIFHLHYYQNKRLGNRFGYVRI